jgi:hypothetical protein
MDVDGISKLLNMIEKLPSPSIAGRLSAIRHPRPFSPKSGTWHMSNSNGAVQFARVQGVDPNTKWI